jgi:RNA polymerase sigma factor (sigma-70 family)
MKTDEARPAAGDSGSRNFSAPVARALPPVVYLDIELSGWPQLPGSSLVATIGAHLGDALRAWCAPWLAADLPLVGERVVVAPEVDADRLVADLFHAEGRSLVRLARLFVDDRNAAEDLVQEAFIRLARAAGRIEDHSRAAAYLRSIVLNLARDHNRRGLVSLRHHLPSRDVGGIVEDEITLRDDQRRVIHALRTLPHRQRDCLVLRYYHELGIEAIADTLGVSANSVKTHLRRGMEALERRLAVAEDAP